MRFVVIKRREVYDRDQAAARLGVPRPEFRWAAASGVVPTPDAGPGLWSRAAVEAMDAEAVRACLGDGPLFGWQGAARLAEALGTPNPDPGCGGPKAVSVAALVELAKDGLLTTLSDRVNELLLAPAEVDALAARPDLRRLLAHAAPLGPDQAAQRLRVRRTDLDHMARLGWLLPTETVRVKFGAARGGTVRVPLYRAGDVDRIPEEHPEVDWPALRALGKGKRSPLARLAAPVGGAQ
ncbi:hypothetical protein [Streptomyces sp. NBC_01264]|uniref:hypothetical protein n=1 Tax=Streptomyces sp. NBC_01264 TaxID=2903804 RepID=UPI00224FA01A|nr:hypothetical protein [Streptomyces sp. NBC_01264]MCX4784621.1 hypothetical protein [Streptomyces sp. NBC_01264]